jgi:type IV secretory pathway TrbF-like protein
MVGSRDPTPADDFLAGLGELEFTQRLVRWSLAVALTAIVALALAILTIWHLWQLPREQLMVAVIDDESGRVVWRGAAGPYELKDVWVAAELKQWIMDCRWRPDDLVVLKAWRERCLKMTDKRAFTEMESFFKQTDPTNPKLAGNPPRVKPEAFRWVKEGPSMYKFLWTETVTPKYGDATKVLHMTAMITVELRTSQGMLGPLLKTGDLDKSDLAIFVIDFLWNPEKEGA